MLRLKYIGHHPTSILFSDNVCGILLQHSLLVRHENAHDDSLWSCAWGRVKRKKDDDNLDADDSR